MNTQSNNTAMLFVRKKVDKIIPVNSVIPLVLSFIFGMTIYSGIMVISRNWHHYNMMTEWDKRIPIMSEWMYIYFGCYLFWTINYIMVARVYRDNSDMFYRFVAADMLARFICGMIFIVFPTTNIRPEVQINSFSDRLLVFLYKIDRPTNLFPSMHCLSSWMAFAGIRDSKKVPLWYKVFSCVFALLVAASTQFTKQHYLVDIVAGFLIGEFAYQFSKHTNMYKIVQRIFTWINLKVLGADEK